MPPTIIGHPPCTTPLAEARRHWRCCCSIHHAKIEATDVWGYTPVLEAARSGKSEMVELLVERGASLAVRGKENETPLMVAKAFGHQETADLLRRLERPNRGVRSPPDGVLADGRCLRRNSAKFENIPVSRRTCRLRIRLSRQ